ncbi:hypothetical protein JCM4814A_24270 [Streptomyces phaeofaciens JCM 4814]|uniref:Uncharacterized protein n=1 Tax=Streptomyces phaeofaciens TaxID=68254 RepID=A0A918LQF2_9ACTN|nr:hypothetical protein [Streptomyces phaeofaciens]GGT35589.1 hypothetical protein GCM10010226_09600 [Streptomyces phaeofaciens]
MPAHQPDDPFEDRLSAALHRTGGAFDSPRTELTAAGARRGRRMQVQRRAAIVGSVAALALVGVGGSLLLPGGTPDASPPSLAGNGSKAATTSYSGDDVVRALVKLLPKGAFTETESRGTDEELPPLAVGVFDDGKGPASLSLGLDRIPADAGKIDPSAQVMPCPEDGQGDLDSCESGLLPDGSAVTVYQGYEYSDRREDTKSWGADLVTPAGQHVSLIEWNAPAEKGEPVSRPEPPLTTAQLKKVAADGVWRRIIDAIPEEERPTASAGGHGGGALMPDYVVMRKLALLLPKGLDRDAGVSQDGYGSFVVDDGKGKGLVQVNVQPGMSADAGQLFGSGAETLPDGTRVATRQEPGEKGGAGVVMWTVDTLRKDGLRVVVSAFNTGDQTKAATRAKPALTMAQLRDIALSPRWTSTED